MVGFFEASTEMGLVIKTGHAGDFTDRPGVRCQQISGVPETFGFDKPSARKFAKGVQLSIQLGNTYIKGGGQVADTKMLDSEILPRALFYAVQENFVPGVQSRQRGKFDRIPVLISRRRQGQKVQRCFHLIMGVRI